MATFANLQTLVKNLVTGTRALQKEAEALAGTGGAAGRQRGRPRKTEGTDTRANRAAPAEGPTLAQLPGLIRERYPNGATPDEVIGLMGWKKGAPMSNIQRQLVAKGLLTKTGDRANTRYRAAA